MFLSNLHILVVASGFVLGSAALLGANVQWWYVLMAAAGVLLVYHTDRAFLHSPEDTENAPERLAWIAGHRGFFRTTAFIAAILVVISASFLGWIWVAGGVVLGCVGMLYSAPFLPGRRRPKDIPYLKTVLIAGCWVGGGALLPALLSPSGSLNLGVLVLFGVYRALYIAPNLLAADFYDSGGDRKAGLGGVGARLGKRSLVVASVGCLILAGVIVFLLIEKGLDAQLMLIDGLGLAGLVLTIALVKNPGPTFVGWLDLWAAFPLVIWLIVMSGAS